MHLLLVTHYYPAHGGGIERVAAALVKRLVQHHDWRITWLASDADPSPDSLAASLHALPARSWNGIEHQFGVPWPVWAPSALFHLWREIGFTDLVHLHDALYFGNAFAWLFARLRGVPVVVTQHVGAIPFRSAMLRAVHALANRTVGRLVLSTAKQVVFISPAVRDEFSRFCRFRAPPLYWPNGVDTGIFSPDGPLAEHPSIQKARAHGRRVLLFVGRFVEKKGLNVLRELAVAMPDDLWIFAGHGSLDPSRWALPNVVVVRGETGAGLAAYYRAADLLVLPSVGEGFPLVVQESMACGTPAMVGEETAAGCPDARALMFVEKVGAADTTSRWAGRLKRLLSHPNHLTGLRRDVAEFARAQWSWDALAQKYSGLFASLSNQRRKR